MRTVTYTMKAGEEMGADRPEVFRNQHPYPSREVHVAMARSQRVCRGRRVRGERTNRDSCLWGGVLGERAV